MMTTTDDVQQTVDAAAEAVAGTGTPSQAPAARTMRAWLLLAGKVVLLLAALVPGNLAFLSGADVKAAVADAKVEAAYAVLRERVTTLDGQLAEVRGDLADLRDLLKVLVAQRAAGPAAATVVGRHGETLRSAKPGRGPGAPDPEAVSDQAHAADLAQALSGDGASQGPIAEGVYVRTVMPAPALPSLDQAVQARAQAKGVGEATAKGAAGGP
jgi:hypothetical protein